MNQNPFGGQDPFEYLRRQMEEQLRQKQQKTNWTSIHLPESDITSVISLDWDSSMPSELMQ